MARFEGKVALVTGATSGIGRATAVAFAREGALLVLAGRREGEGRRTLALVRDAGSDGTFVPTDVTVADDVRRVVAVAVDAYGRLDCAFNNAGHLAGIAPVTDQTLSDLDATLKVNVRGTLLCLRFELEVMIEAGRGAIVNNASLAGLTGSPDNSVYDASKHAVVGLTRSAALEVARQGVRINAICASSVQTAMDDKFRAARASPMSSWPNQCPWDGPAVPKRSPQRLCSSARMMRPISLGRLWSWTEDSRQDNSGHRGHYAPQA
jgi:NAD(P)-dependent dehydrogenase (short-subunit alcohol dehydrogenase family)